MAERSNVQIPIVTISTPVVYLINGDINQAKAAIVSRTGDDGVVDLHQFGDQSGVTFMRRSVRHVDDPLHTLNPSIMAVNGAYITSREFESRRQKELQRLQDLERERYLNQLRLQNDRIVRLAKDGYGVSQIAAQVGVAEGMVETVLREEKVTVAAAPKPAGTVAQ